jgi:flagellar biosynthesis/type III secretory pathway protein FliH
VVKELTRKYNNIQKKVGELMSGAMIQTEARKIRDEGIELGRIAGVEQGRIAGVEQGRNEGRAFEIIRMSIKYNATKDEIITELVEELKMSKQQAEQYLKQYKK